MRTFALLLSGLGLLATSSAFAAGIAHVKISKPDLSKLAQEDLVEARKDVPPRFAEPIRVAISPATHGTWTETAEGEVWQLRLSSDDALSLNFGFTSYQMPEGGRLAIAATDGNDRVARAFTSADNSASGELWTPLVKGSDVVMTVTLPKGKRSELKLMLGSFNYGYRPMDGKAILSGSCNVDVICTEADGWRDIVRSVAVISTGGSRFCTGFLVNNVKMDRRPFFMTANHCGISARNAATLVAYWNYHNSTCREPGSSSSGRTGDGVLTQFTTGATFRAARSVSDFTLVEFNAPIDQAFEVYFAGWNASSQDWQGALGIHHPATHEKRISFERDGTMTTTYGSETPTANGTHVMIPDWDVGTTEPGSSGSPLFNMNGQVIGQLHGGGAACGNDEPDWYGRFSVSWIGNNTPETQLKYWLDPEQTGATELDGLDPAASSR